MKRILLLVFTLFITSTLFAQTFTDNGINYKVTSPTTVEVAPNPNFNGAAIIPISVTNANVVYEVTAIGERAFQHSTISGNQGLTSLSIPNSVKTIGDLAFQWCEGLTSLNLPNSIISIGDYAFSGCTGLTTLIIPNSVTSIGIQAFYYCINLSSVYIPNSVTNIKDGAFWVCYDLTSINIPNSVTSISPLTFDSCGKLKSIEIPNSITSIGYNGFRFCSSLTNIEIPNSVTSIGNRAFEDCKGLTSVKVNWTTPVTINANVFGNVAISMVTLYVPIGTLETYKATPVWQDFGTIIEQTLVPLTLTSLTAKAIPLGNQINWSTANVVNVKNIILERSGADNTFSHLATLPVTASEYIDTNPLAGDNYYRLSTIDNDGATKTYPQIAYVKGFSNEMSFYPNPVSNGVLNIVSGGNKLQSVALFDLNGKKVVFVNTLNSTEKVLVNTQGLVKGVYLLEISSEKTKVVKKVVVN